MKKRIIGALLIISALCAGCGGVKSDILEIFSSAEDILLEDVQAPLSDSVNKLRLERCDTEYTYKQINLFNKKEGWALTKDKRVLYTKGGVEAFVPVKEINNTNPDTDGYVSAAFINEQTAYVTYFPTDNDSIIVEYTSNGGEKWSKTKVNYTDIYEYCDAGSAFISFVDENKGYLLYSTSDAAEQTAKLLFITEDGGSSFELLKDITNDISGKLTGMSFVDEDNGYISVSENSQKEYLYMTNDKAESFKNLYMYVIPDNVFYVKGNVPQFTDDYQYGYMIVKEVSDKNAYKVFTTKNIEWNEVGELDITSFDSFSIIDKNKLYIIDITGGLYTLDLK